MRASCDAEVGSPRRGWRRCNRRASVEVRRWGSVPVKVVEIDGKRVPVGGITFWSLNYCPRHEKRVDDPEHRPGFTTRQEVRRLDQVPG